MEKVITPTFKKKLWIYRIALYSLFPPIAVLITIIGFIVLMMLCILLNIKLNEYSDFGTITSWVIGQAAVIYALPIFLEKIFNKTVFNINTEGIAYNRNLWGNRSHEILFFNIKDVQLNTGWLQDRFGLGDIKLITQAGTAITLFDIEQSQKIYEYLKELVKKATISRID